MSNVVVKCVPKIKEGMAILAEDAMIYPKSDPFEHGVMVGRYQGMLQALQIMIETLKDQDEEK